VISRPDPGPRRIGNALDRLLGSMRAPSVDVLNSVFSRWEEIVGPDLAAHTQPAAIHGDQLVVSVDDPTWASEFQWLEAEVLKRVCEVSGSDRITTLLVRVKPRN
jgi:predicted nucleic acid-binding Zn ribbon protein